jgi:hypothetical protein
MNLWMHFQNRDKKHSGKLKRQAGDFPQRGKSPYSSARSPLRGTVPARLRMPSSSACLAALVSMRIFRCFLKFEGICILISAFV